MERLGRGKWGGNDAKTVLMYETVKKKFMLKK